MKKAPKVDAPAWGDHLRWTPKSRCFVVSCKGCGMTFKKKKWFDHPKKCSNTYLNPSIIQAKMLISQTECLKMSKISPQASESPQYCLQYSEEKSSVVNKQISVPAPTPLEQQCKVLRQCSMLKYQDYQFKLCPKKRRCYYKHQIKVSMIPTTKKYKKITKRGLSICSATPKIYIGPKELFDPFGLLFINDWTYTTTYRSLRLTQKATEQEQIKKGHMKIPFPRSKYCNICRMQFLDYLRHIKGKMHKEKLSQEMPQTQTRTWMMELPSYSTLKHTEQIEQKKIPLLQSKSSSLIKVIAQRFQTKQEKKLIQIIGKAKRLKKLSIQTYNSYCSSIKQATRAKNIHFQVINQSLKLCVLCESIGQMDQSWYQCNVCGAKYHNQCLNDEPNLQCCCNKATYQTIGKQSSYINFFFDQCLNYLPEKCGIKYFSQANSLPGFVYEKQVERFLSTRSLRYTRQCCWHSSTPVNLSYLQDPLLKKANCQLVMSYHSYISGFDFPPVTIKFVSAEIGVGVFGDQQLKMGRLLCEYAGNVLPATFAAFNPKYNMDLFYGNTPINSLIITTITVSSLGPLLNHSDSPNCASLRCVINGEPKILIYLIKDTIKGQQLTYNYNSMSNNYATNEFVQIN